MRCIGVRVAVPLARRIARLSQPWLLKLATLLTVVLWPAMTRRRQVAAINLALCFPELEPSARRKLLWANQHATVMGLLELLRAWYAPSALLDGLADIEGLELLQNELKQGRGVLLLTAHFTHTELAVRLLSEALDRRLGVVVRRNNSACLEAALRQARENVFGSTLEKKDMRGQLRLLRAGDAMVYSADQNFNYQHAFVPFFGVDAATLTSTPELVRRAGARMLPLFFHRDASGRYQLRIETSWPGWMEGSGDQAAAIYMRELAAFVRQHPQQYLWVHRRFKTRPAGQPALYR